MTLSLDTNVVVELVRGRRAVVRENMFHAEAQGHLLVVSLIALHELRVGCELHPDPPTELDRVRTVLSRFRLEPFDEADVTAAAMVRARLQPLGRLIGPYDILIAGQALARGWTVVTANRREFERIEGLNVIDWTAPAD